MSEGLTVYEVRRLFTYCPDTGEIRRRVSKGSKAPAGALVGSPHDGYLTVYINGRNYRLHRLAWAHFYGSWPESGIDHCNRVRSDNRITNLRLCDQSLNMQNSSLSSANTSGRTGVYARTRNGVVKWVAQIGFKGKTKHLGMFASRDAAVQAREEAEKCIHPFAPSDRTVKT